MSTDTNSTSKADVSSHDDDQDTNKQRRLNAIHDARKAVRDARRRADDALFEGAISQRTANTVIRREVENYIHEVEWLMEAADTERDYEGGIDLGTMQLPDGNTYEFVGLQAILETADPIEYTWQHEARDEWDGRHVETHEETLQIPRDVLMAAYRATNGFLFEIGLDLSLEDGAEEFAFDYSDLLGPDEEDPRDVEGEVA